VKSYHHYTIVHCDELDGQARWGARLYDPVRREWQDLGFWYPTQEAVLRESEVRFRELMRENEVAEALKLVIDDFKQKGFSLAEILNGLAELAHRDNYPDRVAFLIEQAVEEAAK
jgi:hypothetical protein